MKVLFDDKSNCVFPLFRLTCFRPIISSHQKCSMKKGVLGNFAKFTGRGLWQSLFFNKVAGLRPVTLLKKRLWHRGCPMNFAKFLRTPFFTEHLWTTACDQCSFSILLKT